MDHKSKPRDNYIDAVKGVGIISIVLGHACWNVEIGKYIIPIGPFVYLYHLAIFAFCTGYVYKINEESIWVYIVKRLRSMYLPFVEYSLIYIACRNIFIKMGVLDANPFSFGETIIAITNVISFNSCGELVGALWFVPMIFFSVILFGVFEKSVNKFISLPLIKKVIITLLVLLCGIVGLYTTERQFGLLHNMQISYLFVPVIFLGSLARRIEIKKYCGIIVGSISCIIMIFVLHADIGIIELSKYMIINKWMFYIITIIGILFCLSLTKLLCKNEWIQNVLVMLGKNSFDIMALHFICFKLMDFILCKVLGDSSILSTFPHSFNSIWLIYLVIGMGGPIVIKKILTEIKRPLTRKRC